MQLVFSMKQKITKLGIRREILIINWLGMYSLYIKEVSRFTNVFLQTITAPMVTTLLFVTVFSVAIDRGAGIEGIPYITFLIPGLLMMSVLQNAFANTSSAYMTAKVTGSIVDLLFAPLDALEIFIAHTLAGITRGIFVFFSTFLLLYLIGITKVPEHVIWAFVFLFLGAFALSSIGIIAGIWAEKFDQLSIISNFVVQPLAFLSGTFYSIDRLPELLKPIAYANPFFYVIDGFRYGFLGLSDISPFKSLFILFICNLCLGFSSWYILKTGYKLKA